MRVRVILDGRTIDLVLPEACNAVIDLTQTEDVMILPDGMSARARKTLYKLAQDALLTGGTRVSVEVPAYCEALGVTPARLGRNLGALERARLISKTRKRNRGGQVVAYEVMLLADPEEVTEQLSRLDLSDCAVGSEWAMVMASINETIGDEAQELYVTLCKLAGIDGAVMASPADLRGHVELDAGESIPLSVLLDALEDGEWISIQEGDKLLCATISNYTRLRDHGMPWEAWRPGEET